MKANKRITRSLVANPQTNTALNENPTLVYPQQGARLKPQIGTVTIFDLHCNFSTPN